VLNTLNYDVQLFDKLIDHYLIN